MHPMQFEFWWRNDSARIQQRAEMAAAVREAKFGEARRRWGRRARLLETVRSGWRGPARAGALATSLRTAGRGCRLREERLR